MKMLKCAILWSKVDLALVGLVEVVANVEECGSLEGISEGADSGISWGETSEPVVGDGNAWDDASDTEPFETGFGKDRDLLDGEGWLTIWVWSWEDVSFMQEDDLDSINDTFVYTELDSASKIDGNSVDIVDASWSWVLSKISCLSFSVSFVVWRDDNNFLTKLGKSD